MNMAGELRVAERDGACRFGVKVTPRSSRTRSVGMEGGVLRLKVMAAPVEGEANEAVRTFLADQLDVPRGAVAILRGGTSRNKTVEVQGLSAAELRRRLSLNP